MFNVQIRRRGRSGARDRRADGKALPVGAVLLDTSEERAVPAEGLRSLSSVLVVGGLLSPEQVTEATEMAQREHVPLWKILVRDGFVTSKDLAVLIALNFGLPLVSLRDQKIEPQAVALLPEHTARRHNVLPIRSAEGRTIIAVADPTDLLMLQDVEARTGRPVDMMIATAEEIHDHIDISYRIVENEAEGEQETAVRVTSQILRQATPARIIELLLQQAVQDRASDIHMTPTEQRLRVRLRIDGILHDVMSLPLDLHPAIISRLKIMSGLNIAERRRPQDGQFTAMGGEKRVDVRGAISSPVDGEMTVLRLLDKGFTLLGLNQLGMDARVMDKYRRLLQLPYGIVVVCGPTGSGKSTTLYASLLQMNRRERNVISLEDPVEYRIGETNQMQVHAEAGVTFASQLRSILRLDPDVILVGEIRDHETASIAIQAALTGHLVLTSLHANDSVSALVRLRDLGIPPYLIASSVAGVVAQRMVRVVCASCRTPMLRPVAEQEAYTAVLGEERDRFIYGEGCNLCAQTGYRGRTGVFEVLTMSDALRNLFLGDAPRHELWKQAMAEGLSPLRTEGMLKVQEGITTPYEVMRVLFSLE